MSDDKISARMRTYILVLLGVVSFLNYIDRQILVILLESVKLELKVSDTAMGLLSGTTFAIFYAGASIPVARLADRGVRRTILSGALAIWSGLTAACGLAQTIYHLAIARAGVATAESAAVPISHSLVADLFPAERRATIFGVLMAAGSLGIAAGLFLGGWANAEFGWRMAFVVVGLPGVAVALLMWLTLPEPVRMADVHGGMRSGDAKALLGHPLYRSLLALAATGSLLMYAMLGWSPTFMIRLHGLNTAEVGIYMGLATGIGNSLGHIVAGAVSDRLAIRDLRWYAWLPAIATFAVLPFGYGFLYADSMMTAVVCFAGLTFFMCSWLMPIYALAYRVADTRARAQASAMIAATMSLVGLGLGPLSVGILNDLFEASYGTQAIRYSLTIIVAANLLLIAGFTTIFGKVRKLASASAPVATSPAQPVASAPASA